MTEEKKMLPALAQPSHFRITTMEQAEGLANLFTRAGLFEISDKEAAKGMTSEKKQAIMAVKIIAGETLGINPIAAARGLHVIKDKVEPGYQTLLAMVAKSPYHDVWEVEGSADCVRQRWYKGGKLVPDPKDPNNRLPGPGCMFVGESKFDTADMQKAGLGGDTWRKYPLQMRRARSTRAGFDAYASELMDGPCMTGGEQEMDMVIEAEGFAVEEKTSTPKQSAATQSEVSTVSSAKAANTTKETKPAPKPASAPQQNGGTTATTGTTAPEPAKGNENATAETGSTTASAEAAEDIQDAQEVDEIQQASDGERPGEQHLGEILQTGIGNGWTEDQVEGWLIPFLESKGVDVSDPTDSIFLTWNFEIVTDAINHLANNKPGA